MCNLKHELSTDRGMTYSSMCNLKHEALTHEHWLNKASKRAIGDINLKAVPLPLDYTYETCPQQIKVEGAPQP